MSGKYTFQGYRRRPRYVPVDWASKEARHQVRMKNFIRAWLVALTLVLVIFFLLYDLAYMETHWPTLLPYGTVKTTVLWLFGFAVGYLAVVQWFPLLRSIIRNDSKSRTFW